MPASDLNTLSVTTLFATTTQSLQTSQLLTKGFFIDITVGIVLVTVTICCATSFCIIALFRRRMSRQLKKNETTKGNIAEGDSGENGEAVTVCTSIDPLPIAFHRVDLATTKY